MQRRPYAPNAREAVLLKTLLHGELCGRDIRDDYERRSVKNMPLGALYTTLDRMEQKGFLTARVGEANSMRGTNRRKYYKITAFGVDCLNVHLHSFLLDGGKASVAKPSQA